MAAVVVGAPAMAWFTVPGHRFSCGSPILFRPDGALRVDLS